MLENEIKQRLCAAIELERACLSPRQSSGDCCGDVFAGLNALNAKINLQTPA